MINPDDAVQFRLRVNQKGSWSAWDRVVNSYLFHGPSAFNPKEYDVYFNPRVTTTKGNGANDDVVVFSFDIMSFDVLDDFYSFIYLDELVVEEVSATVGGLVANFEFQVDNEGWIFQGGEGAFDTAAALILPERLALSPNGSANCFSYWWSPDVAISDSNQLYQVSWNVESSCDDADDTVQFRLRTNQRYAWTGWNRVVNSYFQNAPAAGDPKVYDVIISPNIIAGFDNKLIFSFDIMSLDSADDVNSWLYLNSVELREVTVTP